MTHAVCLFTDSLEPSGVGEHMLALAAELRERYVLAVVCPPTGPGRELLRRAAAMGVETFAADVGQDGPAHGRLRAYLAARRFAVFHAHAGIGWEGHAGCLAARAAGIPIVVRTEHLPYLLTDARESRAYEAGLGAVDRVIAVSAVAHASFRAAGIPAAKLRTIRNGIALPAGTPDRAAVRRALAVSPHERLTLTVGRMTPQKGHDTLLAAAARVLATCPDALFAWAGDGPLRPELERRAEALGLTGRVRFLGRRGDVPSLYAAADAFVLPSRFEGLPLAVLEAMAAGLPVIGTRVCGTDEVVLDGATGRLVPAGDDAALADAILETLSDPAMAARWGAAGRRRVAGHFTAARMARETAAVYEELLAARGLRRHTTPTIAFRTPPAAATTAPAGD